jgi:hypothetical protein
MSNESKEVRDRFMAEELIMGFCLETRGIVTDSKAFERASVAGEDDLELDIMFYKCVMSVVGASLGKIWDSCEKFYARDLATVLSESATSLRHIAPSRAAIVPQGSLSPDYT